MQDRLHVFEDGKAMSAWTVSTNAPTNAIDTGIVNASLGPGTPLWINCVVGTHATSGGAATLQVVAQDSPDGSSWTTRLTGVQFALASLQSANIAALVFCVPLWHGHAKWVRPAFTVGTAVFTAGTMDAWLGLSPAYVYRNNA